MEKETLKRVLSSIITRLNDDTPLMGCEFKEMAMSTTDDERVRNKIRQESGVIPDDKVIPNKARKQLRRLAEANLWKLKHL